MLRRLAALTVTALLGVLTAAVPATAASAATAACLPTTGGPTCQVWTGTVAWVADGDTLLVDVPGDGTSTPRSIRLIGVQAMEQTVYSPSPKNRRGECHALAATARVEQLVKAGGGVVRMTAQHASSTSRGRPLRSLAVRVDGGWRDIGQDLISNGYAIALPFGGEWAWDASYRLAQARAARAGRRLFDTDACGSGPSQSAKLSVWVNSDAQGPDGDNLNGEWIRVGTASGTAVGLAGWWVRDSGLRRYTFARGAVVPAHGAVYVHVGSGRDTATHKYWGLPTPIFVNATGRPGALGDGAYLFDPRGDMRSWVQYPCVLGCASPLAGKVELRVQYRTLEEITLVNTSTTAVDLLGHVIVSLPYRYPFLSSTVLRPGASLRLRTGSGTNDGLLRFWNSNGTILGDGGDVVSLRTAAETTVACVAWGTVRCP